MKKILAGLLTSIMLGLGLVAVASPANAAVVAEKCATNYNYGRSCIAVGVTGSVTNGLRVCNYTGTVTGGGSGVVGIDIIVRRNNGVAIYGLTPGGQGLGCRTWNTNIPISSGSVTYKATFAGGGPAFTVGLNY